MTEATMQIQVNTIHKHDVIAGLRRLGLLEGDLVMVHSSLSSFGTLAGGADAVIDALLSVVGAKGTVLVPTFGCGDAVFDARSSETGLGAIPQVFWKRSEAIRSRHPLASVAAIGPDAVELLRDHEKAETAHAEGTPYYQLYEKRGKILLLGVDQDRNTFLHTAEAMARLPYLRTATARYMDESGTVHEGSWSYFPGPHRKFIGLQGELERAGLVRKTRIGSCVAQVIECRPLLDTLLPLLEEDPGLILSSNPRLPDGIRQRAVVCKQKLDRESFVVAADTQYAGQTIEQIIDNALRFGIDRVVLSFVGGVDWQSIPEKRRKWFLDGLWDAGISVSAIAANWGSSESLANLLAEAKTSTLIVPSTMKEAVIRQHEAVAEVLIENVRIQGRRAAEVAEKVATDANVARIAFNPLEFLRAGENPFLGVFSKTALRRYLGALYIVDGLPTGERTNLGEGLAEIREILSMVRNRSFNGLVVLQGESANRFADTAVGFFTMLGELGRCPE